METKKLNEIVFRDDLYPRFETNTQELIEKYSESIEYLPPIEINQNNILIDGFHRWKAHQLVEKEEINVIITETESEKELKKLAYHRNSNHGLQLSYKEKRKFACEMIEEMNVQELHELLQVGETTIKRWTESKVKDLRNLRKEKIIKYYLHAIETRKQISQQ